MGTVNRLKKKKMPFRGGSLNIRGGELIKKKKKKNITKKIVSQI